MTKKEKLFVSAIIVFAFAVAVYFGYKQRACSNGGGVYVQTLTGMACINN